MTAVTASGPRLSVNVNKVATLRNSRGGTIPSVLDAVRVCLDAGVTGITVHPRADARHITTADVHDIAGFLAPRPQIEFNIEGDPRPDLLDMAIDSVGAGIGEKVLVVLEGKAAGDALGKKAAAVDAAIVGIIDAVEYEG